ncbi:MAG: DNA-directed RNA polymerase subunit alpha, partial [Candidatus Hydrothermota bacterium]
MDFEFILPQGVIKEEVKEDYGRFVFSPLERGYGTTVGNALRRVLLSSIPGYAIIAARIDGVYHEFSTVDGVLEDVPQIVLNLKKIRLKFDDTSREEATLIFKAEGKGVFTARN